VALPQSEEKADWNDYHQQHGLEAATAAFNDSMYQPQEPEVSAKLQVINGGRRAHQNLNPCDLMSKAVLTVFIGLNPNQTKIPERSSAVRAGYVLLLRLSVSALMTVKPGI
jgi:hypothetical protein